MKSNYLELDFEFSGTAEEKLKLICCSLRSSTDEITREYWLNDGSDTEALKEAIELYKKDHIFLAFGVSAEASSIISLELGVLDIKFICLMAEFRCLTNHNHQLQYGRHYIDGRIKVLYPPKNKWEQTEEDKKRKSGKLKHNLSEAVFKFLGKQIDTQHKEEMRQICIRGDVGEIEANREAIQKYCSSDIKYLIPMLKKMAGWYKKLLNPEDFKLLRDDMLLRGDTMANTAIMERNGYPIAFNNLRNFTLQIQDILNECAEDINSQFPEMGVFVLNKREGRYTKKEAPIREWISNSRYAEDWLLTDKKAYSLSLDAFGKHFTFRHSYPRGNFGAQMLRYLKLKQSLNGFTIKKNGKKKKNFWDSVGSDLRVRAYLNPYGSQSGRYQPPSTGFLFLKPAWQRALCVPKKGKMVVGTDYTSQEFLLSALISGDKKMIEAYKTGDVYTAFGKDIGLIPKDGSKKTHPKERQICKATVLGLSYKMSKYGLSDKLTQDTGEEVTEDEAQEYIDLFNETYDDFYEWGQQYLDNFSTRGYDRLPDGWLMFSDNENYRSIGNFPIQGFGSCVLRKAVSLCHRRGLNVCIVLHDALYIECDLGDWESVKLFNECMREAFIHYFTGWRRKEAELIGLDTECWSPLLEEGIRLVNGVECKLEKMHIDERAIGEYEKFSKYFEAADWQVI